MRSTSPSQPAPLDLPGVERSRIHKTTVMPRISGLRLPQQPKSRQSAGAGSDSDWSSGPPSPFSLTSSLLELSPLSSLSCLDLDRVLDPDEVRSSPPKKTTPKPASPKCLKIQQPWSCNHCGSPIIPPSTTNTELYLLSIPMAYSTRSSGQPPATPTPQPPKRGQNRKRKAAEPEPSTQEPAGPLVSSAIATDTTSSVPGNQSKRKKTASAPPAGASLASTDANPDSPPVPTPLTTIRDQEAEHMVIDPDVPNPQLPDRLEPPTASASAPAPLPEDDAQMENGAPSTPAEAPGNNTRNRNQRPLTLREENMALAKANAELRAQVNQQNADIRTLKKIKALYIKEYSKHSEGNGAGSSLIPRPPGEKGKNKWNLQGAMGLKEDDALYAEILRSVRHCISRSGLDWESTYSEQEPGRVAACFKELKKLHPYLERFQGDWPAKEMVISALQNRRKVTNAKVKAKMAEDGKLQADLAAAGTSADGGNVE